ncbi:concanavalin A-like lectin/glucanase domain-containing protein [Phaeosphaeria sp. MPI-PUGE-AT-0046c]|nr:concanavalin A-like lectin/glucanase domain-containing protein [Phaeosphaeria sp. MPI-PUGE-AT-0046c]
MKASIVAFTALLSTAFASPVAEPVSVREAATPTVRDVTAVQAQVSLCSQYAYHAENGYEILNNLWGKDTATSGSQCTYFDGSVGNAIKWSSTWTWQGGQDNVKSYVYAGKILTKGQIVSKVKSMPTSLQWKYDVNNMRCNVAYDIFTAADPNHVNSSGDYEIMIWLGRFGGVWPISQAGAPIAQVTISGYKFDLYFGYNGAMKVYSFVTTTPNSPYTSFNSDVKLFVDYLVQNQQYPASTQNLIVYQVGTEAFTGGPAKFTVDSFSAAVNM